MGVWRGAADHSIATAPLVAAAKSRVGTVFTVATGTHTLAALVADNYLEDMAISNRCRNTIYLWPGRLADGKCASNTHSKDS